MQVWRDPEYFDDDPLAPRHRDVAVLYRQRTRPEEQPLRVPVREMKPRHRRAR